MERNGKKRDDILGRFSIKSEVETLSTVCRRHASKVSIAERQLFLLEPNVPGAQHVAAHALFVVESIAKIGPLALAVETRAREISLGGAVEPGCPTFSLAALLLEVFLEGLLLLIQSGRQLCRDIRHHQGDDRNLVLTGHVAFFTSFFINPGCFSGIFRSSIVSFSWH